jgi:hypothetical protein
MTPCIKRWSQTLGKSKFLVPTETEFAPAQKADRVSGWYADYDEGRFAFWLEGDRQFVSWRNKKVELLQSTVMQWESNISGRSFKIVCGGKIRLVANYHTLLRRPWRIITDILFMDDDWGLVNDLPSVIHSEYESGNLVNLIDCYNAAENSQQMQAIDAKKPAQLLQTLTECNV